jgi:hypothetical protein
VTSRPTHTFGEVLVVHEGAARVRWQQAGDDMPAPLQLWPDLPEWRQLDEHLERGAPLLVVLPPCSVPAVPRLDWLPELDSVRGLDFLAACQEWVRVMPGPLVPPLILDNTLYGLTATYETVRFAWRTSELTHSEHVWREIAKHMFGTAMTEPRSDVPQTAAELPGWQEIVRCAFGSAMAEARQGGAQVPAGLPGAAR